MYKLYYAGIVGIDPEELIVGVRTELQLFSLLIHANT